MIDSDGILEAFGGRPSVAAPPLKQVPAIQTVSYTHDAMIDFIIRDPSISQARLASMFGYTQPWVSRIIASDSFQARLAERKKELVDPGILASVDERFNQMALRSMEIIQEKLDSAPNLDMAFKALDVSSKALGYGARTPQVAINQSFVVSLPEKAASQEAWLAKYGRVSAEVVDAAQKEAQNGA